MRVSLKQKVILVCDTKIAQKGEGVGLSFYAFFANKNDNPELLMEARPDGGLKPTSSIISKKL